MITSGAVYSELLNYDYPVIDVNSPATTTKISRHKNIKGGSISYYVNGSTQELPNDWNGNSTRGILTIINVNDINIYKLILWGYADTSSFASKSAEYIRSSYYNGVTQVYENWKKLDT